MNAAGGACNPLRALTADEVAEQVPYTPRVIRKMCRGGDFPEPIDMKRAPRSWLWNPHDIDAYVAKRWARAS